MPHIMTSTSTGDKWTLIQNYVLIIKMRKLILITSSYLDQPNVEH